MDKLDITVLQEIIHDYGVKETITGLIQAFQQEADTMSDLGLKEKSVQAANMADVLRDLNGEQ
jgi:hypothetical protein